MSEKEKTKICVAMSGGVDSSASALIYKNSGYDVFGMTMNLLGKEIVDAKIVADAIGIDHYFVNFEKEFNEYVIDYFKKSYLSGLTPSPCLMCNKYIKLGFLIEKAKGLGATKIVTGHYAKIEDGHLFVADDKKKDQSYFLCLVKKENLQFLELPLSKMTKDETREMLKNAGIKIFSKPDSQDICFVEDGKYHQLFDNIKEGNIVDVNGKVWGCHKGIIHHTVGQRKGLGVGGFVDPQYVVAINADKNEVVIGPKEELKTDVVMLSELNLLEDVPDVFECGVKLRSKQAIESATVELLGEGKAKVRLKEPAYGVAKGQICCFYSPDLMVLGGGVIIG